MHILNTSEKSGEDKRKVEILYEKYNPLMFAIARKILNNNEDAEDAVFEAWERIVRHMKKLNEIDCKETRSFIVIIIERISIDMYRKRKRNREVLVADMEQSPYALTRDKELEQAEDIQWIRSIPKKYSDILLLYYVNGFTTTEIADILEIKENTVASRLYRGRKMLEKER